MRYEKRYPRMKYMEEQDGIMRAPGKEPCCVCGRLTEFAEINYGAPFCSEECLANFENRIDFDDESVEDWVL